MANLFDHGRPFGSAWLEEKTKIEDHVLRRIRYRLPVNDMRVQDRVRRIQDRLHKYDETFAVRSRRWREEQERTWRDRGGPIEFNRQELERLAEHFEGANDPVSAEIGRKARELLATATEN